MERQAPRRARLGARSLRPWPVLALASVLVLRLFAAPGLAAPSEPGLVTLCAGGRIVQVEAAALAGGADLTALLAGLLAEETRAGGLGDAGEGGDAGDPVAGEPCPWFGLGGALPDPPTPRLPIPPQPTAAVALPEPGPPHPRARTAHPARGPPLPGRPLS